jgi:putative tricarboxylic transport membrane protein
MVDRIIFVCTVLLAAVYLWATSKIPTLALGDPLGPKAFPQMLGIGLLIAAGMLLAEILRARRNQTPEQAAPPQKLGSHHAVILAIVGLTAAYIFAFERLGYMISTAIYLLILTCWFNRGRWLMNVLTSVLFAVISYLVFAKVLDVNLARGVLPF